MAQIVSEAPPKIATARAVADIVVDVLVVGGGGSGLAAAIEAASLGRYVMLIEKNAQLGGSTAWSVGSVSATNTPHQLRSGIRDCPDDHFNDMGLFCEKVGLQDNPVLRRILVDNVPDTFRWLESMGVVFYGPLQQPPHGKPRLHNVLPNSRAYIYHLGRKARALGVDIRLKTTLLEVVVVGNTATAVRIDTPQGPRLVTARGGIVLATGDFGGSAAMRKKFLPPVVADARPINPTNTGDGHRIVDGLGGRMVNAVHCLSGVRFDPPPRNWVMSIPPWGPLTRFMRWSLTHMPSRLLRPFIMKFLTTVLQSSPELYRQGAILINRNGDRFTDELSNPVAGLTAQPDGSAYILLDASLAEKFSAPPFHISTAPGIAFGYIPDYRRSRRDIFHEAATAADLARRLGIDPARLERTLADYNGGERGGRPALLRGPFVALGPVRHYITFSDSGVAVSERHEVIGRSGEPIEALYAVGFIGMGGVLLEGLGHHLGWAFTSGRRAGRFAALRVTTADLTADR